MNVISFIVPTIEAVCYKFTGFLYYKIYVALRRHANQIQTLQVQEFALNVETAISNFARLIEKICSWYILCVPGVCKKNTYRAYIHRNI